MTGDLTGDPTGTTSGITIVVVDDHPVVRDGLTGIVDGEPGLRVVGEASGGVEAVVVVGHHDPDVVLMDLRMPDGSGVAAIEELRRRRGDRPRILVLTTYDTDRDIRGAMEAGADGCLLKDARRAELIRAIRDVAAGRPVLAPAALAALTQRDRSPRAALSDREVQVLRLVAEGLTNRAVAGRLGISEATVKTHLLHGYEKLGAADRASAVRTAWELGLV